MVFFPPFFNPRVGQGRDVEHAGGGTRRGFRARESPRRRNARARRRRVSSASDHLRARAGDVPFPDRVRFASLLHPGRPRPVSFPLFFPRTFAGDAGGASRPSFHTTPPGVSRFLFDLCFVLMGSSGIPSARSFASAASTSASASSTLEKLVAPGFLAASSSSTSRALASYARAAASAVKGADVLRHAADAVDRLVLGLETLLGFGTRAHALVPRLVHAQHGEAHAALASGDGEQLTAGSALGALDVALGNSRELRRGHLLRRGCAAGGSAGRSGEVEHA